MATFAVGSPSIFSVKPKAEKKSGMPPGNGPEKSVIRFMVNHGDIVIMHGAEIHKFYVVGILDPSSPPVAWRY